MKSIKEEAEEFSFIEEGTDLNGNPYKDYNSYKMDGFKKGANYVLKQIIEAIRHCDNDRNTDLYKSLWDCIDALRK